MISTKQLVLDAVQCWPDDITMDQAIERIYVIRKLERAMQDDEAGRIIPHEEVKRMFGLSGDDES